jgi:hypothetical protein
MPKATRRTTAKRTSKQKRTTQGSHQLTARREQIVRKDTLASEHPAGELQIKGLRTAEQRGEVMVSVTSYVSKQEKRNPEAKVTHLSLAGQTLVVTTSDSKLAEALGKQLHRAHKGGDLTITWSDRDVPVRVVWRAPRAS